MRRSMLGTVALAALAVVPVRAEVPVTLRGSLQAMERQHGVAVEAGYPFIRTPGEMVALEVDGALVRLGGNDDYGFRDGVGSLVARPEMRTFIERLSADYRAACDEKLIVTSLTRPTTRQPRNAHRLSVHPAGIAVDLRISRSARCRGWIEDRLLAMEESGLLDVTRERFPPHYHVALFPQAYMAHVGPELEAERAREERLARARAALRAAPPLPGLVAAPEREDAPWPAWRLVALFPVAALGVVLITRGRTAD